MLTLDHLLAYNCPSNVESDGTELQHIELHCVRVEIRCICDDSGRWDAEGNLITPPHYTILSYEFL